MTATTTPNPQGATMLDPRDPRTAVAAWLQIRFGVEPDWAGQPWEVDGAYLQDAANLLDLLADEFPAIAQVLDAQQVRLALSHAGADMALRDGYGNDDPDLATQADADHALTLTLRDGITPEEAADADSPAIAGTELDDSPAPLWAPTHQEARP